MSDEEVTPKSNGIKLGKVSGTHALVVAIISAVLGSTGGPLLLVKLGGPNLFAPDRFTGTDAQIMERRLVVCEKHIEEHPDVELRAGLAALTAEQRGFHARQELILLNQNRIFLLLDAMK